MIDSQNNYKNFESKFKHEIERHMLTIMNEVAPLLIRNFRSSSEYKKKIVNKEYYLLNEALPDINLI